jgi:hypothetical protein
MSDDAEWNPNSWRDAMEQSLRRKAAKVKATGAQPGDSFLVVTEGTVTEPVYFELLLSPLELSRVWVKVMPGKHSAPLHVIATAAKVAESQKRKGKRAKLGVKEPPKFDHIWAVIDTDVAVRTGIWNDVVQLAVAMKVQLAHSTPCFEFWLLLHFGLTTRGDLPDGAAAKAAVETAMGQEYSTNEETARKAMPSLIARWPEAVIHAERVRQYHLGARTPIPANPSTEVDRLIRALNDSAPEHLRRL